MVTLHEVITFLVSMQISISSLQTHNVNRCGRSRHLARKLSLRRDRKSGSAGMPRPNSYAVFCLKKKKDRVPEIGWLEDEPLATAPEVLADERGEGMRSLGLD